MACIPADLIPKDDAPRAVELRRLYAWELYDVQSELVRAGSKTKAVPPDGPRPAPRGMLLWLHILQHLGEKYGPQMSRAMLMQWYTFFFFVLPCHGQLKDGKGIKDKISHCSLCLEPPLQPRILANSHWLPQNFWKLIGGPNDVEVQQPNAAPTKPSAVHLPLFCTLAEAKSKETVITCEKTRLNEGGEKVGIAELEMLIFELIAAGDDGAFTLTLSPNLHYLIASIAFRSLLVACDEPSAAAHWFHPTGLFSKEERHTLWHFFLTLRKYTCEGAPSFQHNKAKQLEPNFSIHLMVHPDARAAPKDPTGALLHLTRYTADPMEDGAANFYLMVHGFHFLVCSPPISDMDVNLHHCFPPPSRHVPAWNVRLSSKANVSTPVPPRSKLKLPTRVQAWFEECIERSIHTLGTIRGAVGADGRRAQAADYQGSATPKRQPNQLFTGLPDQFRFHDALPHTPSLRSIKGEMQLAAGRGTLTPPPKYVCEWSWPFESVDFVVFKKMPSGIVNIHLSVWHPALDPRSPLTTSKSNRIIVFNFVVQDHHFPDDGDRFVLAASFKPLTRTQVEAECRAHPNAPAELARIIRLDSKSMNWPPFSIINEQPLDVNYLAQILIVAMSEDQPAT